MGRDGLLAAERKANSTQNALEEARTLLEQSDRARRITEQELSDTNEQLSELTCQNQAIAGAKRKLESEMQTLHGDLDEMVGEAKISEAKAVKAMVDAARLAEELRAEQDIAAALGRDHKLLECQVKDCQTRLDDAEANALKGGKKAMNKMETRIRELESEVDAEQRRMGDATKNLRKSERRIKEMSYAADEDRKNQDRMQKLVGDLQDKIKSYKKQIEEAEEIAALNLSKFRNAQAQALDSAELADVNEKALAKAKAKARGRLLPGATSKARSLAPVKVRSLHAVLIFELELWCLPLPVQWVAARARPQSWLGVRPATVRQVALSKMIV